MRVRVGFGVLVGRCVFVIVGEGIGELVRVGGGRGELVRVGTKVAVLEGFGLELPACLGRWVVVGGEKVMDAVIVGEMNVTVGENVIVLDASVLDGMIVGVIRF